MEGVSPSRAVIDTANEKERDGDGHGDRSGHEPLSEAVGILYWGQWTYYVHNSYLLA